MVGDQGHRDANIFRFRQHGIEIKIFEIDCHEAGVGGADDAIE